MKHTIDTTSTSIDHKFLVAYDKQVQKLVGMSYFKPIESLTCNLGFFLDSYQKYIYV